MCAGTFVHIHGMQSCEPSCIVVLTGALQATTTWIETSATRGRCGVASMGWSGGHMNTNKYHPGSVWAGVAATGQSNEDCEKKQTKIPGFTPQGRGSLDPIPHQWVCKPQRSLGQLMPFPSLPPKHR